MMNTAIEGHSNNFPPHATNRASEVTLETPLPSAAQSETATGNLNGISLRELYPDPVAHQDRITSLDHLAQLIGNPVRTMAAVSQLRPGNAPISSISVLFPNDLANARNKLSSLRNRLFLIETVLNSGSINHTLPEYLPCKAALTKASLSFHEAFEILNNDQKSVCEYIEALQKTSQDYDMLAAAMKLFIAAEREAPGAYHISATEAALEGIHQSSDALRPYQEPEATPIAVAVPIAVSDQILGQTIKSTRHPQGLSHVKAEPDTPADIEIPADKVLNITPLDQMQKLIEERNSETTD